MRRSIWASLLLLGAAPVGAALTQPSRTTEMPAELGAGGLPGRCDARLLRAAADGLQLERAEVIAAGSAWLSVRTPFKDLSTRTTLKNPALLDTMLPEHCLIAGAFESRTGAGGKPYAIGFELRVPLNWNGRLLFQGGGAYKGMVDPAIGLAVSSGSSADFALADGFAVVTSDSGHAGTDIAFTQDQLARLNYAYASIGKVIRLAKLLVREVAEKAPDHSYFAGCSNGGREAMEAALRFPEEFDGVISANPATDFSGASLSKWHAINAYAQIAPKAADGSTQPWLALTRADWSTLSNGIVAQCDAADGLKDGLIFNHATCHFSPQSLQCRPGQTATCLAPAKVTAVTEAFRGPRSATGREVAYPWTYDASVDMPEWLDGQAGYVDASGKIVGRDNRLPSTTLTTLYRYPPVTPQTVLAERPEDTRAAMHEMEGLLNATQTQLSSFSAKGGKLLLIHGWSDSRLPPEGLVRWYQRLGADMQATGGGSADSFARLFLVPGMTHCGGGRSLDDFDALKVLVDWTENGRAPESFPARGKSFPGLSRPICAYPRFAHYDGKGDPASASSFVCK